MAFSLGLDSSHLVEESLTSPWTWAGEKMAGENPTPKSELVGKEMASGISPLVAGQWGHEHLHEHWNSFS